MTSLVDFLTARLDEETARLDAMAEAEAESCRNDGMPDTTAQEIMDYWLRLDPETGRPETHWPKYLAEIAAKRAIVELHTGRQVDLDFHLACTECSPQPLKYPCRTLRFLAQPYSDHSDYREEWKP